MNKRRLLKLADLLEADAKTKKGVKFDLATWAKPAGKTADDEHYTSRNVKPTIDCSTAACAVGLACISGAFNREGLSYGLSFNKFYNRFFLVPRLGRRTEWAAVTNFFGVGKRDAFQLFSPMHYEQTTGAKAERAVAKRIRNFVAGKYPSVEKAD